MKKNSHFTIDQNAAVDAKIQSDMNYITGQVINLLGDYVHSILLCGGFGRGEGSVVKKNNYIHIVNDYDFTIVLNAKNRPHYAMLYKKFHAVLEAIAVQLASELEIKQIDLGLKPLYYFSNEKFLRIENYEVKKGHILIVGDEDPTEKMPNWRAEEIPLFEGTWLFRNRGLGMLIAALYFLNKEGIPEDKKENFVVECTKAQLAMGDSILLLKGSYHHLYNERLKRAADIDIEDIPEGIEILAGYTEALRHKLRPDFNKFYQRDLREWWFTITRQMDIFYRYFEQKRLNTRFDDWDDYTSLPKPEDRFQLKIFFRKILRENYSFLSFTQLKDKFQKSRRSYSIALIPLILFSLEKDRYALQLMQKAARLIGKSKPAAIREDWLDLAKAVLNEIHPGGEVSNAVQLHYKQNG